MVEGAALEMLCAQKAPRVRIPNSPPAKKPLLSTTGKKGFLLLFCEDEYDKIISTNRDFEEDKHSENHRYLN